MARSLRSWKLKRWQQPALFFFSVTDHCNRRKGISVHGVVESNAIMTWWKLWESVRHCYYASDPDRVHWFRLCALGKKDIGNQNIKLSKDRFQRSPVAKNSVSSKGMHANNLFTTMDLDRCVTEGLYFPIFAVWKQSEMSEKEKNDDALQMALNVAIEKEG